MRPKGVAILVIIGLIGMILCGCSQQQPESAMVALQQKLDKIEKMQEANLKVNLMRAEMQLYAAIGYLFYEMVETSGSKNINPRLIGYEERVRLYRWFLWTQDLLELNQDHPNVVKPYLERAKRDLNNPMAKLWWGRMINDPLFTDDFRQEMKQFYAKLTSGDDKVSEKK